MLVPRIRTSLGRNTLLKISIADEDVCVVVHDSVARTVESRCERNLGNGHADPAGEALAQRSSGSFHAWSLSILRMPRSMTTPLPKPLQFIKGQIEPGNVEKCIEQSAPVASRQNKPVAVWPVRIARVVLERSVP